MYEKNPFEPFVKLDPRRSVQTPTRKTSHVPMFQQPLSEMSVVNSRGESLTKMLLLKSQREKLVKGYKEIIWQQRTMDDYTAYDFDPFNFMDEE